MLHLRDSSYVVSLRDPTVAKPQTCIPQIPSRRPSPRSRHLYPPPSQRLYTIYIYPIKNASLYRNSVRPFSHCHSQQCYRHLCHLVICSPSIHSDVRQVGQRTSVNHPAYVQNRLPVRRRLESAVVIRYLWRLL